MASKRGKPLTIFTQQWGTNLSHQEIPSVRMAEIRSHLHPILRLRLWCGWWCAKWCNVFGDLSAHRYGAERLRCDPQAHLKCLP